MIFMPDLLHKSLLYFKLRTRQWGYRFCKVPSPAKWVFINGCYNSGTTLLHDLLALHPAVGAMPNEGQFFTNQLMTGAKAGVRRLWAEKVELFRMKEDDVTIDVNRLKREWAYFYNDTQREILIEKTIANAARTRWLQANFQPAYFLCIFRNGYAVAEGIRRKEGHSIETAIRQWVTANEILLQDMQSLQHKMILSYEMLTEQPEIVLKSITDFLGLAPLNASVFQHSFRIHKKESTIRNMNPSSLANLSADDIQVINRSAQPLLEKLGYPILNS